MYGKLAKNAGKGGVPIHRGEEETSERRCGTLGRTGDHMNHKERG